MFVALVVLYVLSFALPAFALVRIWRRARTEIETLSLSTGSEVTVGDFNVLVKLAKEVPARAVLDARNELWFVGVGLLAGAAAGIWSLFIGSAGS